jgi:hypothetical protein
MICYNMNLFLPENVKSLAPLLALSPATLLIVTHRSNDRRALP